MALRINIIFIHSIIFYFVLLTIKVKHTTCFMMREKNTLTSQGPYIEKPYLNSNKEPFGMTIKGKSKEFIAGHGHIKDLMIRGKTISTKVGKIRVLDVSHGKTIVNAILEVSIDESPEEGEVELKIHNPSLDKKKGATL